MGACRPIRLADRARPRSEERDRDDGLIDAPRLLRWRKLRLEDARNSESAQERRERFRGFGRVVKEAKEIAKSKASAE